MDKEEEIQILHDKTKLEFPDILSKKEKDSFILYDFPTSKFKLTVTYRIHLQTFGQQYFEYFQAKVSKHLEKQFPNIRFFWKGQEVYIYL